MLRNKEYGEITPPPPPIPFYFFLPNPPHSPPHLLPISLSVYLSPSTKPKLPTQIYHDYDPPPPPSPYPYPSPSKEGKGGGIIISLRSTFSVSIFHIRNEYLIRLFIINSNQGVYPLICNSPLLSLLPQGNLLVWCTHPTNFL